MSKKAIVKEIQVGGYKCVNSLKEACEKYTEMVKSSGEYRAKIIFVIELPNGETKQITIRDEDNQTVAYGDFEGIPDFLEYSLIIKEEENEKKG